jgi:RNA polymerase sigma factor (sigma-70 family)
MGRSSLAPVLHFLQTHLGRSNGGAGSDEHLLERFAFQRDEAAFEAIVERHGPLVWGVCRRVLKREQDIEDAFQATFLVLVRKARSIRRRSSVTSWLHGVAHRIALQARASAQRSFAHELRETPRTETDAASEASCREVRAILDEEILGLPERFRTPLLLCCLEGRTKAQAAHELGWKEGTVASRLARARQRLQQRLTRRGVVLPAGALGLVLAEECSAAVPMALTAATVRMAVLVAAGEAVSAGGVSTSVALLAKGTLNGMAITKLKVSLALILTVCLLGAGAGWAAHQALEKTPTQEQRQDEPQPTAKKADPPKTEEPKQAKKDYYGDPLPPGVLARMGTVQLRQPYADVRFSADGKTLISAGGDGMIGFWDVSSGKLVNQKEFEIVEERGYRSIMGQQILSADATKVVVFRGALLQVFEVKTGKKLCSISMDKVYPYRAAISFDAKILAAQTSGGKDRLIYVWDAATGKELHILTPKKEADDLAFSPDGKVLGAASREGVQLWSTESGAEKFSLKIRDGARRIVFSPDGKSFANDETGGVTIRDTTTGEIQVTLKSSISVVYGLAFSRDGSMLAAGEEKSITLWDLAAKKELRRIARGAGWLSFSPDGKTLASSWQSCIDLWDIETGKPLHEQPAHRGQVYSVASSPNGSLIASMDRMCHELRLWNVTTGKPSHAFDELNINILECVFSTDGEWVVSAKDDNTVRLWDVASGKEVGKFPFDDLDGKAKAFDIQHVRLSSNRKRLVAVGSFHSPAAYQVMAWDVETRKVVVARKVDGECPTTMSPNGNLLVSRKLNGLDFLDTWTGKIRSSYSGEVSYSCVFSPDSRILAIPTRPELPPSKDSIYGLHLVDIADGKKISFIKTNHPLFQLFAFSRDGRMLATAHKDAIRIWKVSTGKELFCIKRPENFHGFDESTFVVSLTFLPDGKALATGMRDSTVLVWDLTANGPIEKDISPDLDGKTLATLWSDLTDEAPKAYHAIWTLGDSPKEAVPFLKERVKPAEEVDPKLVQRLLADLDSDQFATRDKAAKELATLGERIHPALRKVLEGKPSEEVRTRVKAILEEPAVPSGESLRTIRAIQVLERIGTEEASGLLKKLAAGAEGARETREAKDALVRLSRPTATER